MFMQCFLCRHVFVGGSAVSVRGRAFTASPSAIALTAGLALGLLSMAGGTAVAQRLPDPPVPQVVSGPFRIPNLAQFIQSYKQAGSPKLLVACEVFGVAGDTGKTLNNQALAARMSGRMQDAFRNAEVFLVSGGAAQLRRAENDAALARSDEFAAARALAATGDAQVVMYVRLIEQTGRADGVKYTGSYTIADLRRGQSIGSFAWDMYQDGNSNEFDAYRMGDYASVVSTRMAYDFVDAFPLGGEVAGMRSFTIQLVGDYAQADLKGFRDALRVLPGVKADSVRLEREEAAGQQKVCVFGLFYSGDLIDLRSDLSKAAIDQLFMEANIAGVSEGQVRVSLSPLTLERSERAMAGGAVTDQNKGDRDALASAYAKAGSPSIAVIVNRVAAGEDSAGQFLTTGATEITGVTGATAGSAGSGAVAATGPLVAPTTTIVVGNRVDLSGASSLEDLVGRGISDALRERRSERREEGLLDVSYFEAKLSERLLSLRLNLIDLSAAQSKLLSSPEAMSRRWNDQALALELAKAADAGVIISSVGKLTRDAATGAATRVTFNIKAIDTRTQQLLASTSVHRDLLGSSLTFNQSLDGLAAEATGRLVAQLVQSWSK